MNIEEAVNEIEKIKEMFIHLKNHGWINDIKREIDVDKVIESIETLLTAYEKEKAKVERIKDKLAHLKILAKIENKDIDRIKELEILLKEE